MGQAACGGAEPGYEVVGREGGAVWPLLEVEIVGLHAGDVGLVRVGVRVRVRVGVRARVRVGVGVRVEGRGAVLVLARLLAIERLAELDDRRPRALLGLRLGSGLG